MNFNILCSKFLHLYARWKHLRKLKSNLILAVKTTIFLIVIFCVQVSAKGFSQTITFSGNNVPLTSVLSQVRKQSGWHLLYDSELLKKSKKVTVDFIATPLNIVLEKIFVGQPLSYEITGNTILIVDKAPVQVKNKPIAEVIKGTVKDQNGKPIFLATVKIKGSNQSTTTDASGIFVISVPQGGTILLISYIGFKTQEVLAKTGMAIVLTESLNNLEDMVVVGYGATKRKDLTGSVSSIKVSELKNVPFMSVDEALAGKASGVQVIKADGSPGGAVRIRVRGGASLLGTNEPLYVIDGIPVIVSNNFVNSQSDVANPIEAAGGGDNFNTSVSGSFNRGLNGLSGLNISDIETIDILKDASATAIYGSKAANGVVIITTKKGKQNSKPQLSANFYTGINKPIAEKVLNASQYKSLLTESATNYIQELNRTGGDLTSSSAVQALTIMNDPTFFSGGNTNWLDKILRTGYTQNADISVSGGGTTNRYYTSLNYTKQTGTILGSDFKRLSGKINLDTEIGSRLKLITNLNYSVSNTNITNGAYGQALTAPPTFNVFNADGTYSNFGYLNANYRGYQNPVALTTATNNGKDYGFMGSISGEYNILKDLQFKSTFSANYSNYLQRNYTPSYVEIGGFYGKESSGGGLGSNSNVNSLSTFIENTLTWNKTFNAANRLNLLGGTSWENNSADMFSATGRGYPDDFVLNNLSSAVTAVSVRGASPITRSALLSFYLRANYVWKDRYLFTFTGRSDASSKFSPANRVGYFPSGSVAWRISEESFLKGVSWIDELKLRVGAGRTGTQSIGDNLWRTLYQPDSYAGTNAIVPSQLGNARIKWESTTQQDLGLDFNLFKGRFGGTIAYYKKVTDGALLNLTPAPSSAFTSVIYNIAKIQNKGLELELQADFVRGKKFRWNGALNIAKNMSKVLNIEGGPFSDPADRNNITLGTSIVKEGEPLGLLYGRVATGVIRTQAQLDAYKLAFPLYYIFQPTLNIGDMSYKMPEGNTGGNVTGILDVIGKSNPKFFGGYTNVFNYGRFNLTTLFTFSYGGQLMYQKDVSDMNMSSIANVGVRILDHYSAEHTDSERPRLMYNQDTYLSDLNVYSSSYIKLKSLSLGYSLPTEVLKKLRVNSLNIFASAMNLFTITKYPGPDPEVSDSPNSVIGGGRDISSYPTVRSFTLGLRLGF